MVHAKLQFTGTESSVSATKIHSVEEIRAMLPQLTPAIVAQAAGLMTTVTTLRLSDNGTLLEMEMRGDRLRTVETEKGDTVFQGIDKGYIRSVSRLGRAVGGKSESDSSRGK